MTSAERLLRNLLPIIGCLVALALPATAHATFPGANGKIAFVRGGDIWAMNPDGTNQTNVTHWGSDDAEPRWSPDGTKIAFTSNRDGGYEIYKMNADGTNVSRLTFTQSATWPSWSPDGAKIVFAGYSGNSEIDMMNADGSGVERLTSSAGFEFTWSPDGAKIAFTATRDGNPEIYTMNPDGTNLTNLTNNPSDDREPSWSPDGTKIAFRSYRDGHAQIYTMNPAGTNLTNISNDTSNDFYPEWSPDGTKVAFNTDRDGYTDVYTMNPDGTNPTRVTDLADEYYLDWQPIPINAYPRPKGASPMRVSLVPAQQQCTAPNTTHGGPLSFGSCSPPQLASGQLTTGTPEPNGLPARMNASLLLRAIPGNSSTTANEADVKIDAHLNDVLTKDLSDYPGALRASLPLRITDKDNTPSPGGPGAGTTVPFVYGFDIPCTPDPAANVGSDCSLSTTADTLVPGTIKESLRTVWQLGRVRVDDAGPDGNPDTTADNTVFAVQGVFVP